jgi:hypothetical protein
MRFRIFVWTIAAGALSALAFAQGVRIPSPAGIASTEIRGRYVKADNSPASGLDGDAVYKGGKWIEIAYGRPLKRSRDLWGTGANYGKSLNSGAPVWRAGANMSTRIKTEVPLVINGKTVPIGEYSLFIDLKPNNWTLIVSRCALGFIRLHTRQGRRPRADEARDARARRRSAHVGIPRHVRCGRRARYLVGQGDGEHAVQSGTIAPFDRTVWP